MLGSTGFIGTNLVNSLKEIGMDLFTPNIRNDDLTGKSLGNVIYALGVPNFKEDPFGTINAHVCILNKILQKTNFDSFLYISSGRIYRHASSTNEDANFFANPHNLDDLYNISKLMGESLCLSSKKSNVRIVRPSNVAGNNFSSNLFLPSILRDAVDTKKIIIHTSLNSEKDYVYIDDVVNSIIKISLKGNQNIYNIANGVNIKSKDIINKLIKITNCHIQEDHNAQEYSFPQISIERLKNEFQFKPISVLDKIEDMVNAYISFQKTSKYY